MHQRWPLYGENTRNYIHPAKQIIRAPLRDHLVIGDRVRFQFIEKSWAYLNDSHPFGHDYTIREIEALDGCEATVLDIHKRGWVSIVFAPEHRYLVPPLDADLDEIQYGEFDCGSESVVLLG